MKVILLATLVLAVSAPAFAQQRSATSRHASRSDLQAALQLLESSASSTAYSERTRALARQEASAVRGRLSAGDFRVGDRVYLRVVGPTQLVDTTLAVSAALTVEVPGIRSVGLGGVLRSELEAVLARDLGEVVKQVQVHARPLLRIAVVGTVVSPGYHTVSSEMLVDQLVTLSGGPAATASLSEMQIVRADTIIMKGDEVTRAVAEGKTLEALDLRDGDVLMIPPQAAPWDRTSVLSIVALVLGPLITIFALR